MEIIKKYRFLSIILIALFISGFTPMVKKYGKLKIVPKGQSQLILQDLIDKWDDYNIYYSDKYSGYSARSPLGIMFDPKNNDTMLVGDRWKKVKDQKDLIEMTQWICPTTLHEPFLNKIFGPDSQFYGYLYYSCGCVNCKMVGDKKMYVYNLEAPIEKDGDRSDNSRKLSFPLHPPYRHADVFEVNP
ncbi:MAG: hypothetical protein WBB70_02280 [Desulfobacterales bacterium]